MKAVSWNCRGLGRENKVEAIRNIIKTERPDILLLQEKKMSYVEVLALSQHFWTINQGFAINSRGASGGITTFFASKYEIKTIKQNRHWLLSEFKEKDDTNISYVCNVYGPTHSRDKKNFWNSLASLKEEMEGKEIIIADDFNATIAQVEKRGGSIVHDPYGENLEDLITE